MSSNGALTAAVFYKDIDGYIVGVTIDEPATFQGIAVEEGETFINGESAEVLGVELGIYQKLDFLPSPLDGFLVQGNYTYTDATGSAADGPISSIEEAPTFREIALPATSDHTFTAVLGYEKGPVNLRFAGTYRDGILAEINSDGPEFDRFVDDLFQLDFTARYQATDNAGVYFEWINIDDAEFFAFNNLVGEQIFFFEGAGLNNVDLVELRDGRVLEPQTIATGEFGSTEETEGVALDPRGFGPAIPPGSSLRRAGSIRPTRKP